MPNDEEEFKRESLRHAMFKEVLYGELFLAPIGPNTQKIVDLGTGFGDWAIEGMYMICPGHSFPVYSTDPSCEVGDAMPSAKITGIDLSPIQPVWLPPNVEFVVDDIEDEWTDASDFDYVHSRVVFSCLRDPHKVINTAFRLARLARFLDITSADSTIQEPQTGWLDRVLRVSSCHRLR